MTDLEWLREQLARFSYKPGWEFRVDHYPIAMLGSVAGYHTQHGHLPGTHVIKVKYYALDSRYQDPKYLTQMPSGIVSRWTVDPALYADRDPVMFAAFFQNLLFEIEMHESREWLRCDGEILDDPHKETVR